MEKFDPKIYHVDRHDHVLKEGEDVDFISYYDVSHDDVDFELKDKYFREEDRLIAFLIDIFLDGRSVSELLIKGESQWDIDRHEMKTLDKQHVEILKMLYKSDEEFRIESKEDLILLLTLSLRERIKTKIKFTEMIFSSGYDLCLYFQNIDYQYLKRFVEKHQLHILGSWYLDIWDDTF